LAAEPVKDPKATIVSVTLPGQSSRATNGNTTFSDLEEAEPEEVRAVIEPPVTRQSRRLKAEEAIAEPEPVAAPMVEPDEELQDNGDSDNDNDALVESTRRRRRRRSSVTMPESSSDSEVG
jgi:ribonuclease E